MPTSLDGNYWFDEPFSDPLYGRYWEAYRQGKAVADLIIAVRLYQKRLDIRTLYRLRHQWLHVEYECNQLIPRCAGIERSAVFDKG